MGPHQQYLTSQSPGSLLAASWQPPEPRDGQPGSGGPVCGCSGWCGPRLDQQGGDTPPDVISLQVITGQSTHHTPATLQPQIIFQLISLLVQRLGVDSLYSESDHGGDLGSVLSSGLTRSCQLTL